MYCQSYESIWIQCLYRYCTLKARNDIYFLSCYSLSYSVLSITISDTLSDICNAIALHLRQMKAEVFWFLSCNVHKELRRSRQSLLVFTTFFQSLQMHPIGVQSAIGTWENVKGIAAYKIFNKDLKLWIRLRRPEVFDVVWKAWS